MPPLACLSRVPATFLMKSPFAALLVLVGGLLVGCATTEKPRDYVPMLARFYMESSANDGIPATLPQSGVSLTVHAKPVLTEGDVANVELVQVELGKCLMFQLTPSAARDFYRLSATNQGRRMALFINGRAVGARRFDGPITNGTIYVFVEAPEADLPALVDNLRKTSAALQREIKRKS